MQLAFVLWNGALGGAEQFTVMLATKLATLGVQPAFVFLGADKPLSQRLEQEGIEYRSLGLRRGSHVLAHARQFAKLVGSCGKHGAILDSSGYVAAALRLGSYRGRVVSVEHGATVQARTTPPLKRVVARLDRATCAWAPDVEVAVSDFVLAALARRRHPPRILRIYNGVDLEAFRPIAPSDSSASLSIGWAGRMVPGKGLVELLRSVATLRHELPVEVRLLGDGPDRGRLEAITKSLGLESCVFFDGTALEVPPFWAGRDVGAFPTNEWVESFGLAAVEAMACGKPIVASRSGGLVEVVDDGRTGTLVPPGNVESLTAALRRYARDESVRATHGRAGREACERRFDVRETAKRYLALFAT